MSSQEILEKAIQKAIEGGWQPLEGVDISKASFELNENNTRVIFRYKRITAIEEMSVYGIIFNHDFAKALWGEESRMPKGKERFAHHEAYKDYQKGWQYHLQRMVISEDPIKYIGENL